MKKTYEFIFTRGTLADFKARKALAWWKKDFDTWHLNVMLVERLPFEACVARRVDVGYIFTYKWKDCNPRWETIILVRSGKASFGMEEAGLEVLGELPAQCMASSHEQHNPRLVIEKFGTLLN